MIIPVPFGLIGVGLVMAAVSVPLIARMVPMNRWFGVRTRKAFTSEDNCYELDAYGGTPLAAYGAFLVLVGVVESRFAPSPPSVPGVEAATSEVGIGGHWQW
jgi:hypothetical protein